ncbi:DUF3530 family protein [Methylococcus sp. EFPC2]|uniref:DUF3530 family protein n=1 Tax=Methylococcus sp. EFPC2 TaxID=2812648 RepID=UPI00196804CB|nr:DUF3530 family protein [Methylococcus sp. EFPC2]QSA97883.1 DUF3530 family protein [Methylococcus sp. EFPC2]
MSRSSRIGLMLFLTGCSLPLPAADVLREQELARELEARTQAGEMVWLQAQGTRFQALYRDAATRETRGAIVLLHDADSPLDAPGLLRELRKRLPDRGWATLALQGPLREAGADDYLPLMPETLTRIDTALGYLQERKPDNLILLGYRQGGLAVLRYLEEKSDAKVGAAILLDLRPNGDPEHDTALNDALGKAELPLLDILGGKEGVDDDLIQQRRHLMKHNAGYRIVPLTDTDHRLEGWNDMLINRIHGWLRQLPTKDARPPGP